MPAPLPVGPETRLAPGVTGRSGEGDRLPGGTEGASALAADEAPLEAFGLSPEVVGEIRLRDRRQFELFVRVTLGGAALLWVVLALVLYSHSFAQAPLLGLLVVPLLAGLGAVIGALPLALVAGAAILVVYPRHPKAAALEEYEGTHAHTRPCDVCLLVRGDRRPRRDVTHCGRCDAWLCPECRGRYDLRAIAALRAAGGTRARD